MGFAVCTQWDSHWKINDYKGLNWGLCFKSWFAQPWERCVFCHKLGSPRLWLQLSASACSSLSHTRTTDWWSFLPSAAQPCRPRLISYSLPEPQQQSLLFTLLASKHSRLGGRGLQAGGWVCSYCYQATGEMSGEGKSPTLACGSVSLTCRQAAPMNSYGHVSTNHAGSWEWLLPVPCSLPRKAWLFVRATPPKAGHFSLVTTQLV